MTTFNIKPLILTNTIVINITMSMIILNDILFFPNIILYDCAHGIHDDAHEMSNPLPNR